MEIAGMKKKEEFKIYEIINFGLFLVLWILLFFLVF